MIGSRTDNFPSISFRIIKRTRVTPITQNASSIRAEENFEN